MIHLHTHSHYSVLDGLGKVEQIVSKAKEQEAPAVAITDHASINAMPELFKAAKEAGIKPLIGCEFYVVDNPEIPEEKKAKEKRFHLCVWPKTWRGVESVMERLSLAHQQYFRRPRLSWLQALEFQDCCVGTACASGPLVREDFREIFTSLYEAYGEDLYLEVMPHVILQGEKGETEEDKARRGAPDIQRLVNGRAIELCREFKALLIATNDAHYVNREDALTQELLLAIQRKAAWNDPNRWKFPGDVFYMRSEQEMIEAFENVGFSEKAARFACRNCEEVAAKCNVEIPTFHFELPEVYPGDEKTVFTEKIMEGWKAKIEAQGLDNATYRQRLVKELEVIKKLGFRRYFLMVEDNIRHAREAGIMVGPARGSAAGSLVCFLLGITQVDPIQHGLFFERFLNPERIDWPDIDTDFADVRRDEVFQYVRAKYGFDKTGNINTFGKLTAKNAFRDVARIFGLNSFTINYLSKQIVDEYSFEEVPELVKFASNPDNKVIVEQTKKLSGTIRQVGVHACGMVVSAKPLYKSAVMESRKDCDGVVNWDMRTCERMGLIKMDLLGLSTLTVLDRALKFIRERHGIELDLERLPLDDPATLEIFERGQTTGIFQFESAGMQKLLKDLKAADFQTITATTALYRPGSLNSGQTEEFVKIAQGQEPETYPCPQMERILKETRGILVYQEQIMQIFNRLAGFSWAHADKMRKIIGKKLGKDEFEKHRADFVQGCKATVGLDEALSNKLFDQMVEFSAYSFNKSHAVAYTMISYRSAYLKAHYPAEFMAALLTYAKKDRRPVYAREAKRMGLILARPDINRSENEFILDGQEIVAPLGIIKGVGEKAVTAILEARAGSPVGAFIDLKDFVQQVNRRIVNVRVQETLVKAGAFERLGVIERDPERRVKNYAELLPTFQELPSLERKGSKLDEAVKGEFLRQLDICSKGRPIIEPATSKKPFILVINKSVKGEKRHFQYDASKSFLQAAATMGFKPGNFYYTSAIKCAMAANEVPKTCEATCLDHLRREIKMIQPRLIYCCNAAAMPLFGNDRLSDLYGQVIYSPAFDCYVLFGPSPQYAYYNEEVQPAFLEAMEIMGQIFS